MFVPSVRFVCSSQRRPAGTSSGSLGLSLAALAALAPGCYRDPACVPWRDIAVTRSGPDVSDADVAAVWEEIDQMAAWTGLDEVCLERLQLVGPEHAELRFPDGEFSGQYISGWHAAYVSTDDALRRTTRHELCHAVDATLGWPSMERGSPLIEGGHKIENRFAAAETFAEVCAEGPGQATFRALIEEGCPTIDLADRWAGVPHDEVEQRAFVEKVAFPPAGADWGLGVVPMREEHATHTIPMDWPVGLDRDAEVEVWTGTLIVDPDELVLRLATRAPESLGGRSDRLLHIPRGGSPPVLRGPFENAIYREEKRDTWFWPFSGVYRDGKLLIQASTVGRPLRLPTAQEFVPITDLPAPRGIVHGPRGDTGPLLATEVAWAENRPGYIHAVRTLDDDPHTLWEQSRPLEEQTAHTIVPGRVDGPWLVSAGDFHGTAEDERGDLWLTPLGTPGAPTRMLPGPRLTPGGYHPRMVTTHDGLLLFQVKLWTGTGDDTLAMLAYDPDAEAGGVLEGWCGGRWELPWTEVIAGGGVLARATMTQAAQDAIVLDVTWAEPEL